MKKKESSEAAVRNIRRKTRRKYSAEEKIRIVLEGLRGDHSVAEFCRREGISENLFYRWYQRFQDEGHDGLADLKPIQFWNRIPDIARGQVVQIALEHPDKSPGQLAWHITYVVRIFCNLCPGMVQVKPNFIKVMSSYPPSFLLLQRHLCQPPSLIHPLLDRPDPY